MATNLIYTVSDFTPFTKILSADVNSRFQDIKNRLNWGGGTDATTGLGDDNIQSNTASGGGLTRSTKLKAGTAHILLVNGSDGKMSELVSGSAGTFLSSGGPGNALTWVGNPLSSQFNRVIGSAADVSSGAAQYSTIASALAASSNDDRLLLLPSYNGTENVTISIRVYFQGLGRGSTVTGSITLASGSSGTRISNLRATQNVTINSGVDTIYTDMILASGKTFVDNSSISSINYLLAMQET